MLVVLIICCYSSLDVWYVNEQGEEMQGIKAARFESLETPLYYDYYEGWDQLNYCILPLLFAVYIGFNILLVPLMYRNFSKK